MIWCVEDDASIRDIELYALTSTGFEARGFDDGASFWEALQTETPELVLLDVMLPGEDAEKDEGHADPAGHPRHYGHGQGRGIRQNSKSGLRGR